MMECNQTYYRKRIPMLTHRDSKVSVPFEFSGEIGDECH